MLTTLQSDDMNAVNSFEKPMSISPMSKEVDIKDRVLSLPLSASSFSVIRLKL